MAWLGRIGCWPYSTWAASLSLNTHHHLSSGSTTPSYQVGNYWLYLLACLGGIVTFFLLTPSWPRCLHMLQRLDSGRCAWLPSIACKQKFLLKNRAKQWVVCTFPSMPPIDPSLPCIVSETESYHLVHPQVSIMSLCSKNDQTAVRNLMMLWP